MPMNSFLRLIGLWVELHLPKIHMSELQFPGPQNGALLGDKVFKEIIRSKQGPWGDPNPAWLGVLGGNGDTETCIGGRWFWKDTGRRRETETDPPSLPLTASPLTSGWQPQNWEIINACCLSHTVNKDTSPNFAGHLSSMGLGAGPNVPRHSSKAGLGFHFLRAGEKPFTPSSSSKVIWKQQKSQALFSDRGIDGTKLLTPEELKKWEGERLKVEKQRNRDPGRSWFSVLICRLVLSDVFFSDLQEFEK